MTTVRALILRTPDCHIVSCTVSHWAVFQMHLPVQLYCHVALLLWSCYQNCYCHPPVGRNQYNPRREESGKSDGYKETKTQYEDPTTVLTWEQTCESGGLMVTLCVALPVNHACLAQQWEADEPLLIKAWAPCHQLIWWSELGRTAPPAALFTLGSTVFTSYMYVCMCLCMFV